MSDGSTWQFDIAWPLSGRQRIYDLAQPLAHGIPHHPVHPPYAFTLTKRHGEVMYPDGVSAASELLTFGGHVGTHVDSLGHVSKNLRVHGDHDVTEGQSYTDGIAHGSIENIAPFIATGYLVDVPRIFGRPLTTEDAVTDQVLEDRFGRDWMPASDSVILIRTGWDERWHDPAAFLGERGAAPGVDISGAHWLSERNLVATGSDTMAFEKLPSPSLEVHVHLLVERGMFIMEALNLKHLAADGVDEFFFIAAPLRIQGGTGSPIRPLAIVSGATK